MSSRPTVLLIGCGVAGPVLALLLKQKGYHPIVFEKVAALGDAGASLMLNPNGLKVLSLVNGIPSLEHPITTFWHGTPSGTTLVTSDLPRSYPTRYGHSARGVKRTALNLHLKQLLLDAGIELREGWQLNSITENTDSVTAGFTNDQTATGTFLIGSDGIKAASRRLILQKENPATGEGEGPPTFTGLIQVAGISRTTRESPRGRMGNYYGEGVHVIVYPVSASEVSWAVTMSQDKEMAESWQSEGAEGLQARKKMLEEKLAGFEDTVLELVRDADRIISFGLFDRQELEAEQWFSKRCVLVGDAAHPTSPHLGQGANQALEDCYHLSRLLPNVDGDSADYSLAETGLKAVFSEFARLRQPRTSALVKEARRLGHEQRVVFGAERCRERDARLVAAWSDPEKVFEGMDRLLKEPF
ncbi:FAD/NAD(P)-binding domain-containing protein [Aspergillus heteromorphus CBS 117.55]|uniref:FAD/NAD(P)-binding domain-containing protein n=1 Tax=Aspergillus heteromorphus CBS 117.55 TaxID=1448321 RepID=A0A317WAS4_9EURO|nr:FAD/NAD(P)-binding domain-containing protein [Aspergillus heteromorphus CBS 117.55]PWY83626.1 FAD/NAD(P)-binding domain-containing protein [Aspergillus heteromorphus CBS 117.55]